jgi:pilus assembly protein CpaC
MKTQRRIGTVVSGVERKLELDRGRMMRVSDGVASVCKAGLLALAVLACGAPAVVQAEAPAAVAPAPETMVTIDVGTQQLLRQKSPIRRVAVADPAVADVSVISSRELLLAGKTAGVTTLIVWTREAKAQPQHYRVQVASRSISGSTSDLLTHRDSVLAAGTTSTSAGSGAGGDSSGASQAQTVADHTTVAVDTQVMSQVKIVDISRTALQEFGFNFLAANHNGVIGGIGTPGGVSGALINQTSGAAEQITSSTGFIPIASAFNLVYASHEYLGALSLLEQKGLARTLAEPSLTAMSGQTASFLAGGEFPFPTVQNGGGSNNSITIIFKEFGIRLNLTPTVLARNRIALKVAPEVSELDYNNGVSINGITIPGLNVRRTDTSVELGDGETFVISGLVSNTLKNQVDKVPWLGDVPVLGAFFRNTSVNRSERELIMVVTPHLVRPMTKDAPLPELPGAALDQYRPSFAHTMFMESGKFGQDNDQGYSR